MTMERIDGIADACLKLTDLEDPVGEVIEGSTRPNGMKITKNCQSTDGCYWYYI